jgi:hypothetical protein
MGLFTNNIGESEAIIKGADVESCTYYLDNSVAAGADARHKGAVITATDFTQTIPTASFPAKADGFTIYEYKEPIFVGFLSSVDATIIPVPDSDNYNTSAKVATYVNTGVSGVMVFYPEVVAGVGTAHPTCDQFSNASRFLIKRFAVRATGAAVGRLAVIAAANVNCTKIA